MPTPAAICRRFVAYAAALMLCAALAATAAPVARADGRSLLAGAIANTRGSYLVYNFGDGHPAPMLNAGGGWYEMNNGGHLMTIKGAAGRLQPRLLVDSHQGYQARCERDAGRAPAKGCGRRPRSTRRCRRGRRSVSRRSRSTRTSSTCAARRVARGATPNAVRRSAPTSTTPADRAAPTPLSPARLPTRASRDCRAAMNTGRRLPP